jgi:predicted ATPase
VAVLVGSCPGLTVLVTSRFALRLSMEREFPVPALRAPEAAATRTVVALQAYPAVELFAQRAVAVKPGFRLDDDSAEAVAGICRRLDGLPLAIELAAARIKLFSPRALLARLDRGLDLLSGGARDLPARHRTLRQAIGWSYDLLEPGEQAVFRRLSVFAGGCSLESAEVVCMAAGDPGLPALDAVTALVDKSLLRQETAADGEPRFVMLETVREFALEQLASSGDDVATRAAHADLLIELAEAAEPQLTGPGQREWLPRLMREHDDMRAAFDWAIRASDATRALRLGAALGRFWIIRGFHTEGRQRLGAALALPHAPADAAVRNRALSGAAVLAYEQADLAEAIAYLQEALDHYRAAGDERRIAETLNHLGWVAFFYAEVERAEALTQEALALHERRGDTRGVGLSLTNLGAIAMQQGELQRARDLYQRALDLRRAQNDPRSIAYGACNLGWTLARMGELNRAMELAREAERTLRALDDKQILAYACFVLGEVALERGEVQVALPPLEEAVSLGREIMQGASLGLAVGVLAEALALDGDVDRAIALAHEAVTLHEHSRTHIWLVITLRCQGDVLRITGRHAGAHASYLRALHIAAPRKLRLWASECLAGLADLASQRDEHVAAMRLTGAARAVGAARAPRSHRGPDLERIQALASSAIGADATARALEEGAAVDLLRVESLLG